LLDPRSERMAMAVADTAVTGNAMSAESQELSLDEYRTRTMKNYALTIEYKHLQQRAPGGVYVLPSYSNLRIWFGVIFVRQGVYRDGIFKFKVIISPNYPADGARPRVIFSTPVFHPLVDPKTGELDLSSQFPRWRDGRDYLVFVLVFIKKIFYLKSYDIKEAPNPEAVELYRRGNEKKSEFVARINECVQMSLDSMHEQEPESSLCFGEPLPVHKKYFKILTQQQVQQRNGIPKKVMKENKKGKNATVTEKHRAAKKSVAEEKPAS